MKHNRLSKAALLLISLLFISGCATSPRTHLVNIKNDFMDISRLNAGVGPAGYGADIKATKLLHLKADNYSDVYKLGWIGRGVGLWQENSMGYTLFTKNIPIKTTSVITTVTGDPKDNSFTETIRETYKMGVQTEFLLGGKSQLSPSMAAAMTAQNPDSEDEALDCYAKMMELYSPPDELRAALYLGVVGADVGVRPLELVDLAVGLVTLGHVDISKDDLGSLEIPLGDN